MHSWAELAAAQAGMITRSQLAAGGVTRHQVDRLLATAALVADSAGVFAVRGAPDTARRRLWSAVLATDGVVGFDSAGEMWQLAETRSERVHLVVPHGRRVTIPHSVRVHRVFVPRAEMARRDGLPITSRRWIVLDLAGSLPRSAASRLMDRALQQRWLTIADVERRLADYPCRTGNAQLRILAATLGDGAAAESERKLHRILRGHRIDGWRANYPVRAGARLVGVVDVAFVAERLALEVDGFAFHHDPARFVRDRRRQNDLVAAGWTVLRFTWADLLDRPDEVAAIVAGHLRRIRESLPA